MALTYASRWDSWDVADVVLCRRSDVTEEALDDEMLVVDPRTGHTHRLNETAAEAWRLFDGSATTKQIAERMTRIYDVDYETALGHVEQLAQLFTESGLLEEGRRP